MKKDRDMNKILNPPNYVVFILWLLALILIMFFVLTGDRSNVQSAQVIEITITPCRIIDNAQIKVVQFKINDSPYICGKILSEYLPLELQFVLTDKQSDERVYYEVKKLVDYDFLIELPNNLSVGKYEFEVKSARRHFGTIVFEVVE